jgi:GDP-mannose 6-dehydrogenase
MVGRRGSSPLNERRLVWGYSLNISVFGLGYVGAVSLACLARDGHGVIGVDPDSMKRDLIERGVSPIVEPGVNELMAEGRRSGRINVSADPIAAVRDSEISFICVGTPSDALGAHDLSAVRRVSEQIGEAIRQKGSRHIVVVRSTLAPGTVQGTIAPILEAASGRRAGVDFDLCFQPEFLREGSSIKDYDNPPFTVIGSLPEAASAREKLRELYAPLPGEIVFTDIPTAEMLKFCCNAFHAVKVTFANEVGRISRGLDVDGRAVMELLCRDTRLNISTAYMMPGFAFGGSCLPKDLRALVRLAREQAVHVPMLGGVMGSNRAHVEHAFDLVMAHGRRKIALLGLAFKAGTDDLRESPLVTLAEFILGKGLRLTIYDPNVELARLRGSNKRFIDHAVPHLAEVLSADLAAVLRDAEVIVVGMKSPEIQSALEPLLGRIPIVDLVSLTRTMDVDSYTGICW